MAELGAESVQYPHSESLARQVAVPLQLCGNPYLTQRVKSTEPSFPIIGLFSLVF